MNPKWHRFAPIGLYVALLAALASFGLYVVQRQWNLAVQISLAVTVLGLAAFAILDPASLRQWLTGRQARYGSNAVIVLIAIVGILAVLNYLSYQNDKRWDLTEDKTNSLAPETIETLKKLEQPVSATAYYTQRTPSDSAVKLLDQYVRNSKGKFSYTLVNPDEDPVAAQQANITRDGTLVLALGDRSEQVTFVDEQRVTSALVKLMSGGVKNVYFLTGHGEITPDSSSDRSISLAKSSLQGKNYQLKTLNLLTVSEIPQDADVLVIAGASEPYLEGEVNLIKNYLQNGGAAIFMLEPSVMTNMGDKPDLLAEYLNTEWGITVQNDIVVDVLGQNLVGQPFMAVGAAYATHPIVTQDMKTKATFFLGARSLKATGAISGVTQVEVVKTSDQSWGETDLASLLQGANPSPDEGSDQIGSLPLLIAAENSASKARVVVVGDADFILNDYQSSYGNPELVINMMDWAVGQENLINLTPKSSTTRTLNLPAFPYFLGLFFLVSVIVLPGAAIVSGIVVWFKRRKTG